LLQLQVAPRKQTGLRRAREVDKLEERMVLREAGRRLFHREGPITLKDLDLTIVVLAQGTRMSCLYKERRKCKDVAEKGNLMES